MSEEEKKPLEGGNSNKTKAQVAINRRDIPERAAKKSFADKAENFMDPIINDVIIPSAQETILDIIQSILSGVMNSITGVVTGKPVDNYSVPIRRNGVNRRTDYNAISRNNGSRRNIGSNDRNHNVTETTPLRRLTVSSHADAVSVIQQLYQILDQYHQVTCNDLYGLEEIDKTCPYTYTNYGWTDLGNAGIISNGDGTWGFDLPRPVQLNR